MAKSGTRASPVVRAAIEIGVSLSSGASQNQFEAKHHHLCLLEMKLVIYEHDSVSRPNSQDRDKADQGNQGNDAPAQKGARDATHPCKGQPEGNQASDAHGLKIGLQQLGNSQNGQPSEIQQVIS